MRKTLLIILTVAMAICVKSQNITDMEAVIQKCVDLPELQGYYPQNTDGSFVPVHIMQYPMRFDEGLNIEKHGEPPVFMTREEINDNNIDAYFLFERIEWVSNQAFVKFSFYYDCKSGSPQYLHFVIDMIKNNDLWEVISSESNRS